MVAEEGVDVVGQDFEFRPSGFGFLVSGLGRRFWGLRPQRGAVAEEGVDVVGGVEVTVSLPLSLSLSLSLSRTLSLTPTHTHTHTHTVGR